MAKKSKFSDSEDFLKHTSLPAPLAHYGYDYFHVKSAFEDHSLSPHFHDAAFDGAVGIGADPGNYPLDVVYDDETYGLRSYNNKATANAGKITIQSLTGDYDYLVWKGQNYTWYAGMYNTHQLRFGYGSLATPVLSLGSEGSAGINTGTDPAIALQALSRVDAVGSRYAMSALCGSRHVTVNETCYRVGISGSIGSDYWIDTGITDSGYRYGMWAYALGNLASFLGTLAAQKGIQVDHGLYSSSGAGTITNSYGINISSYGKAGTIGAQYAIYLNADNSGGTVNAAWGIYQNDTRNNRFSGPLGLGVNPSHTLHIKAGTTTVAPLKFETGVQLTTPSNGCFEFDGTHLYFDISTSRYQLDKQIGSIIYVAPGTNTLSAAVSALTNGGCLLLGSGTYTQTEAISIPTSVTEFSIIGSGMGATIINFTADVDGFKNTDTDDSYRIKRALMSGFRMTMSAVSSAKTAIYLFGDCTNRTANVNIKIVDVAVERTDTTKYWGYGIVIVNAFEPRIDNFHFRGYGTDPTYYGVAIDLRSCVTGTIDRCCLVEVSKAILLSKEATDSKIYGTNKHGCEGISIGENNIYIANYGVYIDNKGYNQFIHSNTLSHIINGMIYENNTDSVGGYHQIDNNYGDWRPDYATEGGHGIYVQRPGSILRGNYVNGQQGTSHTTNGITVDSAAEGTVLVGNIARTNGTGIWLNGADKCSLMGNIVKETKATYASILLSSGSLYNALHGNQADSTIKLDSGANTNVLTGNASDVAISDSGTSNIKEHNLEY